MKTRLLLLLLPMCLALATPGRAQPSPEALDGFHRYVYAVEQRLDAQHRSRDRFAAAIPGVAAAGRPVLEDLSPPPGALAGALLHHWRATVLLPGAHVADLEQLLRDVGSYPRRFAPEVLAVRVFDPGVAPGSSSLRATLRVRQKHILTVVLDTTYDIALARLDPLDGFSSSRSTRVQEIADAGTAREHALPPGQDHGFVWCQNTYWTYSERPGALLVQVESVSLSRSIPVGLGWAVRPLVQSVPRESLTFTLERTAAALHP